MNQPELSHTMPISRTSGSACIIPAVLIAAIWFTGIWSANASNLENLMPVTLQLPWVTQFQFAGYYTALEKGYYKSAGLDVTISEWQPGRVPVHEVLSGRADFGVTRGDLLLHRLKGQPLTALAVIFQHSASILLAKKDSHITSPHDMAGKRVMMLKGDEAAEFTAMFKNEGVRMDMIKYVPVSSDINELISGKTDVFFAYSTNEPYLLRQRKIAFVCISPRSYGIDFYGDCLFTSEKNIKKHLPTVKGFRSASLKGWNYAMKHPSEVIEFLIKKYHTRKTHAQLMFEAKAMKKLILPDLIQIGHMNPGRWQHMADIYFSLGMADSPHFDADFIFNPDKDRKIIWTRTAIVSIGAVILAGILGLGILWFFNYRLKQKVHERTRSLKQINETLMQEIEQRQKLEKELKAHQENLEKIIKDKTRHIEEEKKRAQAANRAKSLFLANMSHEIRTPMNAILGMNQLVLETKLTEKQRYLLETVHNSSEHLLRLLNDILDFSKIEAGKLEIQHDTFSITRLLDAVFSAMNPLAQNKGLELEVGPADPEPPEWLTGDPFRIKQILFNLIGNAIKFTDSGKITVNAVMADKQTGLPEKADILFTVSDTGMGIHPDQQKVIFSGFHQGDASIAKRFGGTGLGLAISSQLVHLFHGSIKLESTVGKGSCFSFILPLGIGEKPDDDTENTDLTDCIQNLAVLLVEDNSINRELATMILAKDRHRVSEAENGIAGLEALAMNDFDIIFMDIQMPEMDGLSACRIIRTIEQGLPSGENLDSGLIRSLENRLHGKHIPIVAMTANAMGGDRKKCLQAGMDDYITKPFRFEKIRQVIAELAGRSLIKISRECACKGSDPNPEKKNTEEPADNAEHSDIVISITDRVKKHLCTNFELKEDQAEQILKSASQTLADNFKKILSGLEQQNYKQISEYAHSIKGSLLNLGLDKAAALAKQVEITAGSKDIADDFPEMINQLKKETAGLF